MTLNALYNNQQKGHKYLDVENQNEYLRDMYFVVVFAYNANNEESRAKTSYIIYLGFIP